MGSTPGIPLDPRARAIIDAAFAAVSDGIAPLREQVRQLELKVAKLEAGQERRYNTER